MSKFKNTLNMLKSLRNGAKEGSFIFFFIPCKMNTFYTISLKIKVVFIPFKIKNCENGT